MSFREETGLQLDSAVVVPDEDGQAFFAITNNGAWCFNKKLRTFCA